MRRLSTVRPRLAGAATAIVACGWIGHFSAAAQPRDVPRPVGWDAATHGDEAHPDYARLFGTDTVHELRILIPADRFEAMQADLRSITPPFAGRGGRRGAGPGGPALAGEPGGPFPAMDAAVAACSTKTASDACTLDGNPGQCTAPGGGPLVCVAASMPNPFAGRGGRGGRGMAPNLTVRDPIYVPVTVQFEGRVWTHVGMRYKGNSSLMSSVMSGNGKIPFRLDFDRYEDEHPEIRNQRFHGFNELTFSSNVGDDSQLREAFATEVFRDRGVPAARAAFYRIVVDTGKGPEYWGLYTMIEDPADGAMLDAQFGSGRGNLYKPEGAGANWAEFNRDAFSKKTNERQADYRDIAAAIEALHSPRAEPRAWRAALEARFDVDHFLKWLAVNTAIQNWDAYGAMAHNYYLYGDPAQEGRLRWIPWDHNFSLGASPAGRGGRGFLRGDPPAGAPAAPGAAGTGAAPVAGAPVVLPPGRGRAPGAGLFGARGNDVLHASVGSEWPLIQLLLADELYATRYREHLEHALGGLFAPDAAARRLRHLHTLIAPSVLEERPSHTTISSREGFELAIDGPGGLLEIVKRQHGTIRAALDVNGAR